MAVSGSSDDLRKAKSLERDKSFAEAAKIYDSFANSRPEIALKLGDWYTDGKIRGVQVQNQIQKDETKAIEYYNKALGIPDAYAKIGSIYLDDKSDAFDEKKGISYCEQGIYRGSVSAYVCLSNYYYRVRRYNLAFRNAFKGAKAGNTEALALLGLLFSTRNCNTGRDGFDTNYIMAARCFEVYIDLHGDDRRALNRYALLLTRRLIDPKEFPSSKDALFLSARNGRSASVADIAEMFRVGRYDTEKNIDFAVQIIKHYYVKNPTDPIIAERFVTYSLLGLCEPLSFSEIDSIFEGCSQMADNFRILMGFILYHGINCKIDLVKSKRMFESVHPNNPISQMYLNLIEQNGKSSTVELLQGVIRDPKSNKLVRMLSSYNLVIWLMEHPQSLISYDDAWTLLKSIHVDMPYVNLLPIMSKTAICRKMVKNIDETHPWFVTPLRKSIRIRDPEAQENYADYVKDTDPDLAIRYYERSARCGNSNSLNKLDTLRSEQSILNDDETQKKIVYLSRRIQESNGSDKHKLVFLRKYLESDVETILDIKARNE